MCYIPKGFRKHSYFKPFWNVFDEFLGKIDIFPHPIDIFSPEIIFANYGAW